MGNRDYVDRARLIMTKQQLKDWIYKNQSILRLVSVLIVISWLVTLITMGPVWVVWSLF